MSETFTFKDGREADMDFALSVNFGAEYDALEPSDKLYLIEDCWTIQAEETYSTAEDCAAEYRARIGGGDNIALYARCFNV